MAIPESLKTAFDKGDFDAVESAWLERVDDAPEDLDFFIGSGRTLIGQGQEDLAKMLFRLLEEEIADDDNHRLRLKLLRRSGALFHSPKFLQAAVVESLRATHGGHGRFDDLLRIVGLNRAIERESDLWRRVDNLLSLLDFDTGTIVTMDGHGVGEILDINTELESFRVKFPSAPPMNVGFRAAAKLMTAIPADSLRHRLVVEPEAASEVLENEPHRLLRELLEASGRAMSGAEIKKALHGVLPQDRWTAWWAAARKHPQVVTDAQKPNSYRWADSGEEAREVLLARYRRSDLAGRLRVLGEVKNRPQLLSEVVERLRAEVLDDPTSTPEDIALTWVNLHRIHGGDRVGQAPVQLLQSDARELAETLIQVEPASDRQTAYELLAEQRADWPEVVQGLLNRESEPRLAGALLDQLAAEDRTSALVDAIRKSSGAPALFVWVAEAAAEDARMRRLHPVSLLRSLIRARSKDGFESFRPRLTAMFESGGTVPRLLAELDEEQAAEAYAVIQRARIADTEREGLVASLETRFPGLRQEQRAGLYALRASIDSRREELRLLKEEEIPANRKAVEEAAALGDLRENFEYKSARERQEYLSSRVAQLEADLARVHPLDLNHVDKNEIRIGSKVVLSGDPEVVYTILGPWESDPGAGVISYQSDLGRALLGKVIGDRVAVGDREREVLAIGVYSDDSVG